MSHANRKMLDKHTLPKDLKFLTTGTNSTHTERKGQVLLMQDIPTNKISKFEKTKLPCRVTITKTYFIGDQV